MTQRATIEEIDRIVTSQTAPQVFLGLAAAHPDLEALNSMVDGGGWDTTTMAGLRDKVAAVAAGYQSLGIAPGERVLLMMRNRPDFHWFDIAAQFVRATPVSIYNSSSPEEIQYLADHA